MRPDEVQGASDAPPLIVSSRPIIDVFRLLPHCTVDAAGGIDYAASDPAVLVSLGAHATRSLGRMHYGTRAIGQLLARLAQEIETGALPADLTEDVAFLIVDLVDLADQCHRLAVASQAATVDYCPVPRRGLEPAPNDPVRP